MYCIQYTFIKGGLLVYVVLYGQIMYAKIGIIIKKLIVD